MNSELKCAQCLTRIILGKTEISRGENLETEMA